MLRAMSSFSCNVRSSALDKEFVERNYERTVCVGVCVCVCVCMCVSCVCVCVCVCVRVCVYDEVIAVLNVFIDDEENEVPNVFVPTPYLYFSVSVSILYVLTLDQADSL